MAVLHTQYLDRANAAASRRDFLSAMQYGLRAVCAPSDRTDLRCDAQMLLAMVTLELGDGLTALAYAVGAQLGACRVRDLDRQKRAAALLATVVAQHPHLGDPTAVLLH